MEHYRRPVGCCEETATDQQRETSDKPQIWLIPALINKKTMFAKQNRLHQVAQLWLPMQAQVGRDYSRLSHGDIKTAFTERGPLS